ncbi:DUF226 domain-containing protein (plasmid) [Borreliella sinica]|uniref:DUF226 domain-containing protein n=1 Tax=Borreliella sinica TaxID=87162 RepID=UPI003AF174B8
MNILKGFKARKDKLSVYFINSFNKEKKWINLFPVKDGDAFLGMFYGFKKVKFDKFYSDYVSVCKFSKKKFKTFNKAYYIEFRFAKGSIFFYIHTIAYLVGERDIRFTRKLYKRILDLEKEVFKFYSKDLDSSGIITKWIARIKQKEAERLDQIGNLINPPPRRRVRKEFRRF